MKKVVDYIEYYYKERGFNCAETILNAANGAWDMQLSADAKKLMGGFGGGMGKAIVCGAVSGGVAALSCKMVKETGHKSPELMNAVRKFIDTVREECGSEICKDIHGKYATQEERCLPTIRKIAEILDRIYAEVDDAEKQNAKTKVCDKVSMPESIREFVDVLYTPFDQEILLDTDDEGYVVKKYRRSWLDHLYKRAVLNKIIEEDGKVLYKAAHVAARLESFIVLEKAYWISLPEETRKAITDRYIMNPDLWNEPRLTHPEMGDTILPIEEALKVLEASDTEYYFLAECNCNNYIMGCEKDKYRICTHFPKNAPKINSPDGRGLSQRVTKEEAIEAVKYADRQGLIHKLGPTGESFCNCCTCCCIHHHDAKKYEEAFKGNFLKTPYIIETQEEKCIGCGACTKRCQFGALTVENGKVKLNADKCWGCGVCRVVCPKDVLVIKERENGCS